jgi:hypothetical protein
MENEIIITAWKARVRYSDRATCDFVHIPNRIPADDGFLAALFTRMPFAVAQNHILASLPSFLCFFPFMRLSGVLKWHHPILKHIS